MTAGEYDFTIEQGATFTQSFQFETYFPLTSYTASLIAKTADTDSTSVLDMSTANGRITITPASSTIAWSLAPTYTNSLTFTTAAYHMQVTSGTNVVTRILEGVVTISKRLI
jgi:hypothetical protein